MHSAEGTVRASLLWLRVGSSNKNVFSVESYLSIEKSPTAVLDNVITEHMLSRAGTAVTANCDVIW